MPGRPDRPRRRRPVRRAPRPGPVRGRARRRRPARAQSAPATRTAPRAPGVGSPRTSRGSGRPSPDRASSGRRTRMASARYRTSMPPATRPAAIVFDLDGTLVDTVGARIDAWAAVFAEYGIPVSRQQLAPMIGMDGRRLALEVTAAAETTLDETGAEEIDRRAGEAFEERNRAPRPLPGAREALARLDAAAVPWAIATSSRAQQVASSVAALGQATRPRIIDGSTVAHAKPAPDLLLLAARQLGVDPERCWYVGDS